MRCILIFLLAFFTFSIHPEVAAQENVVVPDSGRFYHSIESYSKNHKLTRLLYPLFFRTDTTMLNKGHPKKGAYKSLIQKPYSAFEGKIIRNINIQTLDPFGKSIKDTVMVNRNFILRAGNTMHIKSLHITIRNLLLIRENQVFDSLLVKESERLVRKNGYVHDVLFSVISTSQNSDSVDIYIREMDKWSILPKIGTGSSRVTVNILDKNFAGLGHEIQLGYSWNHTLGANAYRANYYISNIRNTYINATFHFDTDEKKNYIRNISIDRPFFSSFAKWAAGMDFVQQFRSDSILTRDLLYVNQRYKFNTQDYWAGLAIQIFKGNSEDARTTNLITTVRYLRIHYLEQPPESLDPDNVYSNEDLYLAGIGMATRKYVQDNYIFAYGITEDVPVGRVISLTGGYQIKNAAVRPYLGARYAHGDYYTWGYLGSSIEYGTYLKKSKPEEGVLSAGLTYFTGLIESGNWRFRQFIKPSATFGINRIPGDSLTLKDGVGLDKFNSTGLSGSDRLLVTFQTQSYAPWNLIGFRFGPYLTYSAGVLSEQVKSFKNSRVYSQIGIGLLIKNEKLVFNSFQMSIAFYPLIPGTGSNVLKMNSFKASDVGFKDYAIGKPESIIFQ
ncbi:MAG TPA: hypothetical protein PLU53_04530 [Bacteroidia bacterium]|nr:hypothetical protein [Bacteroidia bacterium]